MYFNFFSRVVVLGLDFSGESVDRSLEERHVGDRDIGPPVEDDRFTNELDGIDFTDDRSKVVTFGFRADHNARVWVQLSIGFYSVLLMLRAMLPRLLMMSLPGVDGLKVLEEK